MVNVGGGSARDEDLGVWCRTSFRISPVGRRAIHTLLFKAVPALYCHRGGGDIGHIISMIGVEIHWSGFGLIGKLSKE